MYITRKIDYALRLLVVLGSSTSKSMTSEDLSTAINVPRQFTLKIAQALTKAGFITAQRGVGGGIRLARDPETVTLSEIISATESNRALNTCLVNPDYCTQRPYCAAHHELRAIQNVLDAELKRVTLAQLIRKQITLDQMRVRNATPT